MGKLPQALCDVKYFVIVGLYLEVSFKEVRPLEFSSARIEASMWALARFSLRFFLPITRRSLEIARQ